VLTSFYPLSVRGKARTGAEGLLAGVMPVFPCFRSVGRTNSGVADSRRLTVLAHALGGTRRWRCRRSRGSLSRHNVLEDALTQIAKVKQAGNGKFGRDKREKDEALAALRAQMKFSSDYLIEITGLGAR